MARSKKTSEEGVPAASVHASWLDESAWKTAQLAAILATRYPVPHGQQADHVSGEGDWNLVRDEATPQLDAFYLSLLRRAQFLLANANARVGDIHASALFDPHRHYTLAEITRTFSGVQWRGLTTENTVSGVLAKIRDTIEAKMKSGIAYYLRLAFQPEALKDPSVPLTPELSEKIANLEAHPELIAADERIPSSLKQQISLINSMREIFQTTTVGQGPEKKHDAWRLFDFCAEHHIMDDKLWFPRSKLHSRRRRLE